jgi:DNA-binding transcriptional MocR family regulator
LRRCFPIDKHVNGRDETGALENSGGGVHFVEPEGGYFVWLRLPREQSGARFIDARRLREGHGNIFKEGHLFGLDDDPPVQVGGQSPEFSAANFVRLSFANFAPEQMALGVEFLRDLIAHYRAAPHQTP